MDERPDMFQRCQSFYKHFLDETGVKAYVEGE